MRYNTGWCYAHYMRWWYTGDVGGPEIRSRDPLERFWSFVDKTDSCWLWTGQAGHGYGGFSYQGKSVRAHRLSYEIHKGPIPAGMTIDHLCRNRRCVNPGHLEAVDFAENIARAKPFRKRKTHCPKGHPYTPDNYIASCRGCRECNRTKSREYQRRRAAKRRE